MQKIYSFAAFLLLSCYAFGQTGSLKGNLKDGKTAEGLIGATIRIEGTQIGTMTDIEGNFIISRVPAGVYKVVASLVGYDNYEIKAVRIEVDKTTIINSSLNEANTTLNAVTVKEIEAQRFRSLRRFVRLSRLRWVFQHSRFKKRKTEMLRQ
jgi:CarboxypepD_reg-like domain